MITCFVFVFISLFASMPAHSAKVFKPTLTGSGLKFSVGYSAGVHKGVASEIDGSAAIDVHDQINSLNFKIPIRSMSTGNLPRDCHMREALGLDAISYPLFR